MKKIVLATVLCLLPLLAHAPKSVELEFDPQSGILNVLVTHRVSDASKHYIYKITVELNGEEMVEQKFSSQTNTDEQDVLYSIHDAKEGDKIKVTAFCNISGKRSGEITVVAPEKE
jgi:desulfoferrodoxin (superoxide reductase-like protein)